MDIILAPKNTNNWRFLLYTKRYIYLATHLAKIILSLAHNNRLLRNPERQNF